MGILDALDNPSFLSSLLGINTAQAASGPPQAPPPSVMSQAGPSFSPNSAFDNGGALPTGGAPPSFADRFPKTPEPGPEAAAARTALLSHVVPGGLAATDGIPPSPRGPNAPPPTAQLSDPAGGPAPPGAQPGAPPPPPPSVFDPNG